MLSFEIFNGFNVQNVLIYFFPTVFLSEKKSTKDIAVFMRKNHSLCNWPTEKLVFTVILPLYTVFCLRDNLWYIEEMIFQSLELAEFKQKSSHKS